MNKDPRAVVDDYLTNIARKAWPRASVTVHHETDGSKAYQLEVPGETPFRLGKVFGAARMTLRAVVFEHLPPEANRDEFMLDVRVISDERKPGVEDLERALRVGKTLRDESSSRSDAVLAGKLLALSVGGAAFTVEDVRALRRWGTAKGPGRADYDQLADALAYWCDLGDPKLRSY